MSVKQEVETKESWTPFGKPWETVEQFSSFQQADEKRNLLLTQWGEDTNMRVKVRRTSDGLFRVRIRDETPPKKGRKGKKGKKKNE